MTSRQPDGWHTLTTRLVATDAERLVQFLRSVFHVTGDFRPDRPAEIRIGDSVLMVSGADERSPFTGVPWPTARRRSRIGVALGEVPIVVFYVWATGTVLAA